MPPACFRDSNTVTSNPSRARTAAQESPAGPDPMTAAFLPFFFPAVSGSNPVFQPYSARNLWIFPIFTALSMPVALQASSHSTSVGQTTPHTPSRGLFFLIVLIAPLMFLNLSFLTKSAGSVEAGQALLHGASWQRRHLQASLYACVYVSPSSISLTLRRRFSFLVGYFN